MRPGQNKRSRGRNGGMPHHGGGGGGGGGRGPGGPRPPHRSQTFDSNGPNIKIRGNAYQVFERYIALAREAQTSGDRIPAENPHPPCDTEMTDPVGRVSLPLNPSCGLGHKPTSPSRASDADPSDGDGGYKNLTTNRRTL